MKKIALALIATLTLCFAPVHAADFQKGLDALDNGDYAAALIEFKSLAEQGDAKSQYSLGWMYSYGKGVAQDDKEAAKWYRLAAEQGHANAQSNMGVMYRNGEGVVRDYVRTHMWFNISSASGDDEAGDLRDSIVIWMTSEDISKAQSMAKECMDSNYKNCGY